MESRLFTYGTIQPGANLEFFEKNNLGQFLIKLGEGTVRGDLLHIRNNKLNLDYPGLVNTGSSRNIVWGTLFAIEDSEKVLALIDKYEGYTPNLSLEESRRRNYYERVQTEITLESDNKVFAQVYGLNRESDYFKSNFIKEVGLVVSGNWLRYQSHLASK